MIQKNAFFCQNTEFTQNTDSSMHDRKITDEMMKLIKTKCATKHSMTEVAKILGVKQNTLWNHMQKSGNSKLIYSNIYNDYYFKIHSCYFIILKNNFQVPVGLTVSQGLGLTVSI